MGHESSSSPEFQMTRACTRAPHPGTPRPAPRSRPPGPPRPDPASGCPAPRSGLRPNPDPRAQLSGPRTARRRSPTLPPPRAGRRLRTPWRRPGRSRPPRARGAGAPPLSSRPPRGSRGGDPAARPHGPPELH